MPDKEAMLKAVTSEGEICNKIELEYDRTSFLIEEKHTISDIVRWIIEQGWYEEVKYLMDEVDKVWG
jgi:hypothetical protein